MKKILCVQVRIAIIIAVLFTNHVFGQTLVPGSMQGIPSVTPTGAFTYSIPIAVPPGIRGLAPKISLVYNSQSGNGIAGYGWDLAGLSEYSRRPTDAYHDEVVHGIDLYSDVFVIDENRIIDDGAGAYTTLIKNFSKISYPTYASGLGYVMVETTDGLVYEYGNTPDSKIDPNGGMGGTVARCLNRIHDRNGNYIDFEYLYDFPTGDYRISRIRYGGNYNTGTLCNSEVDFTYAARVDQSFRYVYASKLVNSGRLYRIDIIHDGVVIHKYDLHYDYSYDNYSKLASVTETGETNHVLPTTIFSYGEGTTSPYEKYITSVPYTNGFAPIVGDLNGDGFTDFINSGPAWAPEYRFDKNSKNSDFEQLTTGTLPYLPDVLSYGNISIRPSNASALGFDYDGDGKGDIITICNNATDYYIFLNKSNGASLEPVETLFHRTATGTTWPTDAEFGEIKVTAGRFAGNGKHQLLVYYPSNPTVFGSTKEYDTYLIGDGIYKTGSYTSELDDFVAMDYDGDGKDELFTTITFGYECNIYTVDLHYSGGTVAPGPLIMDLLLNSGYPNKDHRIYFGDFNGDGNTDVLTWAPTSPYAPGFWEVGYGGGGPSGFNVIGAAAAGLADLQTNDPEPPPNPPCCSPHDDFNYIIGDYNGDGKDDILETYKDAGTNVFKVYYMQGSNQFTGENLGALLPTVDDRRLHLGDYNGDGQMDIMMHMGLTATASSNNTIVYFHPNEKMHLLTEVDKQDNMVPANGHTYHISYKSLPQDDEYDAGTPDAYPFCKISAPIKVVKSAYDNFLYLNKTYKYEGLTLHKTGLGLRGFTKFTETDVTTGKYAVSDFDVKNFETVQCLSNAAYDLAANTLQQTTMTYGEDILPNNCHVIYPKTVENKDYVKNIKSLTTYNYSPGPGGFPSLYNYGKPDNVTVDIGNGTEVTSSDYVYNVSDPFFYNQCKVQAETTTVNRAGSAPYVRRNSYSYYPEGLLSAAVKDAGSPRENTIANTSVDGFGNVYEVTSSVAGMPTVVEDYTYSTDGLFLIQKINSLGQSTYNTYDKWGNVTASTDINGLTTSYTYDDFNQVTSSTTPTSIVTETSYDWANALPSCPPFTDAATAVTQQTTGILGSTITFFDYAGRARRTVTPDFTGNDVYRDKYYNSDGHLGSVTQPYSPTTSQPVTNPTVYYYDNYGRVTTETTNIGTISSKVVNYSYTPLMIAGDPMGMRVTSTNTSATPARSETTETDGSGRKISVTTPLTSLNYSYNSNGKLSSTIANDLTTSFTYDDYGNLVSEDAPNKNTTNYAYDFRDRMAWTTDANGVTYAYTYDVLDRVVTKVGPEGAYTYEYDGSSATTFGKLMHVVSPVAATEKTYTYDAFSRLESCTELNAGTSFTSSYTYDLYNRVSTKVYPNGDQIQNLYNAYGYFNEVGKLNGTLYTPLWHKDAENVLGQTTESSYASSGSTGALFREINSYNPRGFLTSSELSNTSMYYKLDNFEFDEATGDLLERQDYHRDLTEDFTYDALDRLTSATQSHGSTPIDNQTTTYRPNGNIRTKSEISVDDWRYDKYAVITIPEPTAVIPSAIQVVTYTPFNKILNISEGPNQIDFTYNADQERMQATYSTSGTTTKTRYYAQDFERTIDAVGSAEEISYVAAEGKLVAMIIHSGGSEEIKYINTDYLGSITHIIRSSGTLEEERSYTAWGRMRNPNDWTFTSLPTYTYDRGYTSQEQLRDFNVINLNGRLYDPLIGRMFSVDKYILDPSNSQCYNGYSYALNNPMKYTDKDGNNPLVVIYAVAGLIGGGINVANNWDKIVKDPWSAVGYFGSGAVGGMMSLTNPSAAVAATSLGNAATDAYFGSMPKMNDAGDVLKYSFFTVLDATSVACAGGLARPIGSLSVKWGWTQSVTSAEGQWVRLAGGEMAYSLPPTMVTNTLASEVSFLPAAETEAIEAAEQQYTRSNLRRGQEMHRAYKAGLPGKEYTGIKGIRPDYVDLDTKTIYELKPNNPRAIKDGMKQLSKYKAAFENQFGGEWSTVLDTY